MRWRSRPRAHQAPLTLPSPWDQAREGDRVAACVDGRWQGTTLARTPRLVDGVLCAKPAGLPWTPLDLMRLGGMTCPGE